MNLLMLKFAVSLCMTLFTELPAALLFHARGKDILLVFLVNVLTNPAVVLISAMTGDRLWVQAVLEVIVVFIEGCYYKRYSTSMKHAFMCSLCCNVMSYGIGILIR